MITALSQISIGVSDIESATAAIARLLAREPSLGEEDAVFQLANTRLALTMSEQGDGLSAITFEVDDATNAFRAVERRALAPQQPVAFAESDTDGATREGHYIDLD